MSEIPDGDKEILVVCGCNGETIFEYDDAFLHLYDVEEKKWYSPFRIDTMGRRFIGADCMMGVVGSELYIFQVLSPCCEKHDDTKETEDVKEEEVETSGPVGNAEGGETDAAEETSTCRFGGYCLDLLTKEMTHVGDFPYLPNPDPVLLDVVHSFTHTMLKLNNIESAISKDPDALKVYYSYGFVLHHNGCIYGQYGAQDSLEDECSPWRYELMRHNLSTEENKIYRPSPLPNDWLRAALMNGKIYAVDESNLKNMAVYDIEADDWEAIRTWGPITDYGRLVVCNGRLLCVENCRIYEYDFDKKEWNFRCHDYKGPIVSPFQCFAVKKSVVANWE